MTRDEHRAAVKLATEVRDAAIHEACVAHMNAVQVVSAAYLAAVGNPRRNDADPADRTHVRELASQSAFRRKVTGVNCDGRVITITLNFDLPPEHAEPLWNHLRSWSPKGVAMYLDVPTGEV